MSGIIKNNLVGISAPVVSGANAPEVHKKGTAVDIQVFHSNGVWIPPKGITMVYMEAIGAGGGGGGG